MTGEIVQAWEDDSVLLPKVEEPKPTAISVAADNVTQFHQIARFRGKPMYMENEPYPHYVPMNFPKFQEIAYAILGGMGVSKLRDTFAYLSNVVEDLTPNDRYILFGFADFNDATGEAEGNPTVWDMRELTTVQHIPPTLCIWRSPYSKVPEFAGPNYRPIEWIMDLAGGSQDHYDDIMQSIAPLVMEKKPDGAIWWIGEGANGKSTLMDALYRIFPDQLASINLKRLTDERDAPGLNGHLANVVKESNEGHIADTNIYKSIGTHEDFRVHTFHSQDDTLVRGNLHHIFSGNAIPTFNEKGHSASRRTFIIPFKEQFASDPDFEKRTFTKEMFGRLIMEMCHYATRLKRQGYKYKWSAVTLSAKAKYDAEASNGEEYARQKIAEGVVGFEDFTYIKVDYENWCAELGYVPLGVKNMRKAMLAAGFEEDFYKGTTGKTNRYYHIPGIERPDFLPLGLNKPGFFTAEGFAPELKPEPEPQTALPIDTPTPEPPANDIIKGKW